MSIYHDMRRAAMEQAAHAMQGGTKDAVTATLMVGLIYALLAIASAISELTP